jgi:hypothetical protein
MSNDRKTAAQPAQMTATERPRQSAAHLLATASLVLSTKAETSLILSR